MKGFREFTERADGMKILYPISGIKSVAENDDGRALIELDYSLKNNTIVFCSAESYEEVKEKIKQNEV